MNKDISICFVNPPSPFLINPKVFPPLGLLSLATAAFNAGYKNIQFIDLNGSKNIKKDLFLIKADIFFISATTPQLDYAKECIYELRKYNITSKFVIGGPHPTVKPEDCFFVDSIVVGEGEEIILEILKNSPNLQRIYIAKPIENLDTLPFINRNFIDIKKYAYNYILGGQPTTTYLTSRGCSYGKCAFCCRQGKGVRYRSAQNIFDEVKQVKMLYSIKGAMFFDDEFVSNKPRLKEFCKLLIENSLDIKWRCLSRVTSIDSKIVPLMKEAGCTEIALGIESVDDEILENITKHITVDKAKNAIKIIKKSRIAVKELFIVGLPGESPESIQKMDDFVVETKPNDVDFTLLSVFPGSEIYNHPEKFDICFNKNCRSFYKSYGDLYSTVCKISTSKMSFDELLKARDMLESKYKPEEKLRRKS